MKMYGWMMRAAVVAAGWCLVGCEGMSISLGPDGKFSVSGSLPPAEGKVVVEGK